jgi:sulfite reductase beta subunit-like hemoprotein
MSPKRSCWCSAISATAPTASTRVSNTPSTTTARTGSAANSTNTSATNSARRGPSPSRTTATATAGTEDTERQLWHLTSSSRADACSTARSCRCAPAARDRRDPRGDFRLTANQNLIIANVSPEETPGDRRAARRQWHHGQPPEERACASTRWPASRCRPAAWRSPRRALPAGPPHRPRGALEEAGLRHDAITIRMTGCPNGCARPFLAEIGFVGRGPAKYNVYLGGGFAGQRLSKLYRESCPPRKSCRCSPDHQHALCQGAQRRRALRRFLHPRRIRRRHRPGRDFHKNIPEARDAN